MGTWLRGGQAPAKDAWRVAPRGACECICVPRAPTATDGHGASSAGSWLLGPAPSAGLSSGAGPGTGTRALRPPALLCPGSTGVPRVGQLLGYGGSGSSIWPGAWGPPSPQERCCPGRKWGSQSGTGAGGARGALGTRDKAPSVSWPRPVRPPPALFPTLGLWAGRGEALELAPPGGLESGEGMSPHGRKPPAQQPAPPTFAHRVLAAR